MGKYQHLKSDQIKELHSNLYLVITGNKFGDSLKDELKVVGNFLGIKPDRWKQVVRGFQVENGGKRKLPPGRAMDAYLRHTIMHLGLVGAGLLPSTDFIDRYQGMHDYFAARREPYHEELQTLQDAAKEAVVEGDPTTKDIISLTGLETRTYYVIRKGRTSQGATTGGLPALYLLYSLYLMRLWAKRFKQLPDLSLTAAWGK